MRFFISDFSSLLFRPYVDIDESDTLFIQNFAESDLIRVQAKSKSEIRAVVRDLSTGGFTDLTSKTYIADNYCDFYDWSFRKKIGKYQFIITLPNDANNIPLASALFDVCSKKCLENTIKIRYRNRRNQFDCIFIGTNNYREEKYFDIRFKGGFLNRENEYNTENENFRNQDYRAGLMSGFPYKVKTLTIGDSGGVPEWVGDKLARIFSLSDIEINGSKYTISEAGEIEKETAINNSPMRVFKVKVEPELINFMEVDTGIKHYVSNKNVQYASNLDLNFIQNTNYGG